MIQTISREQFIRAFRDMNREENFTIEGRAALYEYLEENFPDTELDVIAICCEWAEGPLGEVLEDYDLRSLNNLEEQTIVIRLSNNRVVYQQF